MEMGLKCRLIHIQDSTPVLSTARIAILFLLNWVSYFYCLYKGSPFEGGRNG